MAPDRTATSAARFGGRDPMSVSQCAIRSASVNRVAASAPTSGVYVATQLWRWMAATPAASSMRGGLISNASATISA